jgi:hypothetical protein
MWEHLYMSEKHVDNHGQTPAAWTAVIIMIFAFFWGGLGLILGQAWMFWSSFAIFLIGPIVGKVMQSAGYGAIPKSTSASTSN